MLCAKNVSNNLSRCLGKRFRCAITKNVRKYLGVPLLHGRVIKATYKEIVKKINCKKWQNIKV